MRTFLTYTNEASVIKNPKYQVMRDRDKKFYFHLKARTGDVIITSKPYECKDSCVEALNSIKEEADFNFNELEDKSKKLYSFEVVNHADELIASSENYTTRIGRGKGILSVMRIVCHAPVEDMTA